MTNKQYGFINEFKKALNLPDDGVADMLCIGRSTVRRWRTTYNIPAWVKPALEAIKSNSKRNINKMKRERLK